ncbi:MAG TPA: hypothetical protein VGQ87_00490 [Patescibacteria group bacterium]|jgi:hypothetical protein|nr:hypothetical protein [Patescibacteria group bacterium]
MRRLSELTLEVPALQEHGPDDPTFKTRQTLEAELVELDQQLAGK